MAHLQLLKVWTQKSKLFTTKGRTHNIGFYASCLQLFMKHQNFQIFLDTLLTATKNIDQKYFQLPVTYRDYVVRERAYCYELYHQIRERLPTDFTYTLSGEVNKAGHPLIAPHCGQIIPDFLIHNPGHMGQDDNLIIVEVKTIEGANYAQEGRDLLKDMQTINCMTSLKNGYYKGIILIFGSGNNDKKNEIENVYRHRCNTENVLLLYHDNANTRARVL